MPLTYEELKHKTLADLREIAKGIEHEAVQGYTQLNKEHLIVALAKALGIHHTHHDVVGIDKSSIKARIRELKTQRASALEAHDHAQLKVVRRT
ncbi:MAG TPA: Rho termination factor N-terminal domain-containing protein, partial [Pyrinomonadaceae bacterium]|nr:Rho termination factor N-terminal domain-containing protein [Pyrinomonadaceae bacterium]